MTRDTGHRPLLTRREWRTVTLYWALIALSAAGVVGAAWLLPMVGEPECLPAALTGEDDRTPAQSNHQSEASPVAPIVLAGSGAALPLVELLAADFAAAGGAAVEVAPSIGTVGGLRALADGAVDLAFASRPLTEAERTEVRVVPLARAPVAVVAGRELRPVALSGEELLRLFAGELAFWPGGERALPILRDERDSGVALLDELFPGFAESNRRGKAANAGPEALTDGEAERLLVACPNCVGVVDWGTVGLRRLPVAALPVGDLDPQQLALESERWPLLRPLFLVLPKAARPEAEAFAAFATSPAARQRIGMLGYLEP